MEVRASFAKTWEAAVDVFAERNIPIKTVDRASGLIVAEVQAVSVKDSVGLADCGSNALGIKLWPDVATWNLLVRGDSTRATVKANVRFVMVTGSTRGLFGTEQQGTVTDCSTLGKWETDFETQLKAAAEKKK